MISRIHALWELLEVGEALLVTSEENRRYLTGFPSSAGAVLITKNTAELLIDFRYFEKAKATVKHMETVLCRSVAEEIAKREISRLYLETESVTLGERDRLAKKLPEVELSADGKFSLKLSRMRAVKSERELSLIRDAQKITDKGFSYILERISEGRSEREIALELEFFMRKEGSEGVAFDFIVVSGENSSLPHGVPGERKLQKGDFVTMDFGAVAGGYRSDMTRTVAIGRVSDEQRAVYNTVLSAQEAALREIRAGKICRDIDKTARDIIENAGFRGCFGHGLGHSVGLYIHENPSFNTACETELLSGMVMTVEPGIYLEGRFGVRIEDMICVTDGGFENLTASRKDLIIL